jgi:hypothetical protein
MWCCLFSGYKRFTLRDEIAARDGFHVCGDNIFLTDHGARTQYLLYIFFFYHFTTSSSFLWNKDLFI